MYRILVVDDEPKQLRILSKIIRARNNEYEVKEANNGKDALDLCVEHIFDLIICDIRMPVMGGLEFIEKARVGVNNHAQIVVLSGYGEFAYAQRAIELGVTDYLLKPIEENNLYTLLDKMEHIKLQKKETENRLNYARTVYAANWLRECTSSKELMELIPNTGCCSVVCVISEETDMISSIELEALLIEFYSMAFFREPHEKKAIAVLGMNEVMSNKDWIRDLSNNLYSISESLNHKYWMGVGDLHRSDLSGIRDGCSQAESAVSARFYKPNERIFFYSDIQSKLQSDLTRYPTLDDNIFRFKSLSEQECLETVIEWISSLTGEFWVDPDILKSIICGVLAQHHHSLEKQLNINEVVGNLADQDINDLNMVESFDDLKMCLCKYFCNVRKLMFSLPSSGHWRILDQCIKRMTEQFHPDLSLTKVASWCHLSPSYFSILFKQHTGKKFTDYLLTLRLSQAVKLLRNSDLKVFEISREVGFQDAKYFSRLFKSVYGVSPDKFRSLDVFEKHEDS